MGDAVFRRTAQRDERSARRIDQMTGGLVWLRHAENNYVIFGDCARADRYVQFAHCAGGSGDDATSEAVAVSAPILVAVTAAVGVTACGGDSAVSAAVGRPPWAGHSGYFGEPDHEPLTMEVGSGLWPRSSSRGLADDVTVVARLAALGLRLGDSRHSCRNFCRENVTEPSDILAAISEEIMVGIVRARPTYRLSIERGHF